MKIEHKYTLHVPNPHTGMPDRGRYTTTEYLPSTLEKWIISFFAKLFSNNNERLSETPQGSTTNDSEQLRTPLLDRNRH